ncbi:MAG TPA: hypothetical protein VMI35_09355 [Puia sp.]|nr:hypothetical protein [Puia sp.]
MDINRNNYEEFFLLYVDEELSAAERRAVEFFVRENTDLEEEFLMVRQTKLNPDTRIVFDDKESLLKNAGEQPLIGHHNYEEYFLLYADGELDPTGRQAVEKFAAQQPALRGELDLFLQARMEPDPAIVFACKDSLYRHAETRKLPAMPWFRIAAAAMILLLAGWLVFENRDTTGHLSTIAQGGKTGKNSGPVKKNEPSVVTPVAGAPLYSQEQKNGKDMSKKESPALSRQRAKDNIVDQPISGSGKTATITDYPVENNRKQASMISIARIANTKQDPAKTVQPDKVDPVAHPLVGASQETAPQDVAVGGPDVNPYARQASLNEMLSDGEDGIRIMAFSAKKNTMRGLFRKVSRVFEKTTSVDNESKEGLLVGNLQVPLKK